MIRPSAHQMVLQDQQRADETSTIDPTPWLQVRDVGVAGLVLLLGLASWCLPEHSWRRLADNLAARRLRRSPGLNADELATVKVLVGDRPTPWIEQNFRKGWLAHKYLSWMQLLACYWPRSWQPKPQLIGQQHLDVALARGRGVLLLTANFAYQDLMAKASLAQAGYPISHLSRNTHGFFESKFARWLLNPIYTSIEKRFLKDRMVFREDRTEKVNALIKEKLRDNQPVMVLVTPLGRRVSVLPFLHGQIRIATGALNFACDTGATVLPVFTVQRPDGTIQTIVEPGLTKPKYRGRGETIETMLQDYVPRLEVYVSEFPDQFSFPSSSAHGEALIQPASSAMAARPSRKDAEPKREEVAELV